MRSGSEKSDKTKALEGSRVTHRRALSIYGEMGERRGEPPVILHRQQNNSHINLTHYHSNPLQYEVCLNYLIDIFSIFK